MPKVLVVGSDHAGLALKRELAQLAGELGYEVRDLGTHSLESTDYPDYALTAGDEFGVTAEIQNIGEADAWEAKAELSANPAASIGISPNDPDGGYVKDLGNLIGHDVNETETVTWLLIYNGPNKPTITISATGFDEFGYEVKQICTSEISRFGPYQITCCELLLDGTPGAAILDRFVEPDSITVDPDGQEPGPSGDEGGTAVTIDLVSGWNLISSPWYVESGADRLPENFLDAVNGNLTSAYAYFPSIPGWQIYILNPGSGQLPL